MLRKALTFGIGLAVTALSIHASPASALEISEILFSAPDNTGTSINSYVSITTSGTTAESLAGVAFIGISGGGAGPLIATSGSVTSSVDLATSNITTDTLAPGQELIIALSGSSVGATLVSQAAAAILVPTTPTPTAQLTLNSVARVTTSGTYALVNFDVQPVAGTAPFDFDVDGDGIAETFTGVTGVQDAFSVLALNAQGTATLGFDYSEDLAAAFTDDLLTTGTTLTETTFEYQAVTRTPTGLLGGEVGGSTASGYAYTADADTGVASTSLITNIPEPSVGLLSSLGLLGLGGAIRSRFARRRLQA